MQETLSSKVRRAVRNLPPKTSTMHWAIIFFWMLILFWFNPRFFTLYSEASTFPAKISVTLLIICLDIFWLFGTLYIMMFIFTLLRRKVQLPANVPPFQPNVAILYLTMNDFQYDAALSCLQQDYANCHLFILDDSTQQNFINTVAEFQVEFPDKVTIIRRDNRVGFKAGSINNALKKHISGYPYFAVFDSDGIAPKHFLSSLMPYFNLDDNIGFIQASHRPNPVQKSNFASDLALGIIPLWTIYYGPRNDYGVVIFLGHGGIIKLDVWELVGGLPEVVSEDLAFTTRIAEFGYKGYFVEDVISFEDFPETYPQLRKQQEKYIKGCCEYLHKYFPGFLRSKNVTWFEKLDVFLACLTLFIPVIYILFLVVFALLLPYYFAEVEPLHVTILDTQLTLGNAYRINENLNAIWSWDFYVVTVLMMFAPVLGCLKLILMKPIQVIRLLFLSAVPYLSLMIVCVVAIMTYVLTKKAAFLVTASSDEESSVYSYGKPTQRMTWLGGLNYNSKVVKIIELILGAVFAYFCLATLNLSLMAFALSLVLGFFLSLYGWDNKILKPLMYLPFFFIILAILFLGAGLLGAQGVFLMFFLIHF